MNGAIAWWWLFGRLAGRNDRLEWRARCCDQWNVVLADTDWLGNLHGSVQLAREAMARHCPDCKQKLDYRLADS